MRIDYFTVFAFDACVKVIAIHYFFLCVCCYMIKFPILLLTISYIFLIVISFEFIINVASPGRFCINPWLNMGFYGFAFLLLHVYRPESFFGCSYKKAPTPKIISSISSFDTLFLFCMLSTRKCISRRL